MTLISHWITLYHLPILDQFAEHLKNMPLIISKRHTIGVSNYKSTGGVVPTPQRQVFLLCFCVSHTVSLSVQLLLLSMQLWTKESKAQAACILWTETLAVSVHSSTQWPVLGHVTLSKKCCFEWCAFIDYIFTHTHTEILHIWVYVHIYIYILKYIYTLSVCGIVVSDTEVKTKL